MWANRITLEMIKHSDARDTIANKLKELTMDEDCITKLCISADNRYMFYEVHLFDKTKFKINDNGEEVF